MNKTSLSILAIMLFFSITDSNATGPNETYVYVHNFTNATLTVWATYIDNRGRELRTGSGEVSPRKKTNFLVPIGKVTIHAEARKTINPKTGTPYKIAWNYQTYKPRFASEPEPIYFHPTAEAFGARHYTFRDIERKGFSGNWECGKAVLNITQNGNTLGGKISGNAGKHEWIKTKGSGIISGEVKGNNPNKADIYIEFPDSYYVRGKDFVIKNDGKYMSGLDPIFSPEGKYSGGGHSALECNRVQ